MKSCFKKILILSAFVFVCNFTYASKIPDKSERITGISFDEYYNRFIEAIKKGENIIEDDFNNPGRLYFFDQSNSLIIGCSPVAYTYIYARDLVARFKYDLIGFGSTTDKQMLEWFRILDKKYNRIVVWGEVNDVFEYLVDGKELDQVFFDTLDNVLDEAVKHLKDGPNSKVVFINVKEVTEDDGFPADYVEKFNNAARKINFHVRFKGIESVDIKNDTSEENSEWYLHFNNPQVFRNILCDIESLGERILK